MRTSERLILKIVEKGPILLPDLCDQSGIARTNIYRYLDRLERGHYITRSQVFSEDSGKMETMITRKTGYCHDPMLKIYDYRWDV